MRQDTPQWLRRVIGIARWYVLAILLGYGIGFRLLVRHAPAPWPQTLGITCAGGSAVLVAYIRRRRVERVLSQPPGLRCPNCGYSLKFNQGRCPECGRPCIVSTGRFADVKPAIPDDTPD
jgi:hypothetical protein